MIKWPTKCTSGKKVTWKAAGFQSFFFLSVCVCCYCSLSRLFFQAWSATFLSKRASVYIYLGGFITIMNIYLCCQAFRTWALFLVHLALDKWSRIIFFFWGLTWSLKATRISWYDEDTTEPNCCLDHKQPLFQIDTRYWQQQHIFTTNLQETKDT